jgi:hypothetical protein
VDGEKKILKHHVFLENSNKPSSFSGDGIPYGILLLTNKRLFFFYINQGKLKNLILKALPGYLLPIIADEMGGESFSKLAEFLEHTSEIGEEIIDKLKEENEFIEYFDNERSFVIPLKRIINYQKTRFIWQYCALPTLKKSYFKFEVRNNDGSITSYCVYSHNPKRPFNATRLVSPFGLHRKMKKAKAVDNSSQSRTPRHVDIQTTNVIITIAIATAIIITSAVISVSLGPFLTVHITPILAHQSSTIKFEVPSSVLKPISEIWKILFSPPILYIFFTVIIILIILSVMLHEVDIFRSAIEGGYWIVIGLVGVSIINMYSLDRLTGQSFLIVLPSGPLEFFLTIFTTPWFYILAAYITNYVIQYLIQRMGNYQSNGSSVSTFGTSGSSINYYCMSCGTKHDQLSCPICGSKMKRIGP